MIFIIYVLLSHKLTAEWKRWEVKSSALLLCLANDATHLLVYYSMSWVEALGKCLPGAATHNVCGETDYPVLLSILYLAGQIF